MILNLDRLADMLDAIRAAGGRPIIVGGAVRDALLRNAEPKDIDIEVFGLELEDLHGALAARFKVNSVGKCFGVLKVTSDRSVHEVDVSIPRREMKTDRGHRGFETAPDASMRFEDAAARRDFTVNAIGFDPLTGEFLDPFDGISDLHARVLRATSPQFCEDPLRVLRACQFAARFQMTIDPQCIQMCKRLNPELPDLPSDRLREEWKKLLLKADKPSLGIDAMRETGVLETLFPELDALIGVAQDPQWHPEGQDHPLGSLWVHNQMVVDEAAKIIRRDGLLETHPDEALIVMLGALCHDLGKPATTVYKDGRWRSPGHEEAGVAPSRALLQRMGCPGRIIDAVLPLVDRHLAPSLLRQQNAGNGAVRRLALQVPLQRLVRVAEADYRGRTTPEAMAGAAFEAGAWLLERAASLAVTRTEPKPLLTGKHLIAMGMRPGRHMGTILLQAFEAQMDDAFADEAGALAWAESTFAGHASFASD